VQASGFTRVAGEQQYFGSITNCAPEADPDGGGMPNLLEYLADTNPTQAN
jgi:hypothetical protein